MQFTSEKSCGQRSDLEQSYDTRISLEDLDLDNFRSIARIARFLSSPKGSNGHTDP